jgi:exopolysaccharide production protein ExoQ
MNRHGQLSLLSYFSKIDVAMMFGWVISTTMPFGWAQPFRYLAAAYFLGSLVLFARQTMPTVVRSWPTFIIPVLCVISATWAPDANDAIRKGMLFALTAAVAIYAATRLSGRQILTIFMIGETLAALMCIQKPTLDINGAWTGIFGQKNFLAVHMFILYTSALALALDKGSNRWFRFFALGAIPMGLALILLAKSATTTLLTIGATAALVGHAVFWAPAGRVRHMRTLLVLAASVLVISVTLVLFGLMRFDAQNSLLEALGKDSTLTGRTYLWATAERVMAEHPLTGVGAEGFWRQEYGVANSITEYFHYESYVRFSFHSSYLENGVALGYPGYWATVLLAVWAIWRTSMNWLRNQTTLNAAFLILAIMVIIRSTAEIDLAQEFSGTSALLFIGAARKEKRDQPQGPQAWQYPSYPPFPPKGVAP